MTFILTLLLAPLVAGLGSDDFARREASQRALEALSWLGRPALERARRSADPEVAWRAELALARCTAPWRRFCESPYRQPGWCDGLTAKWYAADGRWRTLLQDGKDAGVFGPNEFAPWPAMNGYMPLEEQIKALINWGRSRARGDGVLTLSTPWQQCAHPDGPPRPMPPPGSRVID